MTSTSFLAASALGVARLLEKKLLDFDIEAQVVAVQARITTLETTLTPVAERLPASALLRSIPGVGATVAALNGMTSPVILIAGGDGKGQDAGQGELDRPDAQTRIRRGVARVHREILD